MFQTMSPTTIPWIVFSLMAFVVLYPFTVYPACLWVLSRFFGRGWTQRDFEPVVSVVVPAHNEGQRLKEKIQNCLELEYPNQKLDIIVVSDGSTDDSEAIVNAYAPRVRLVRTQGRVGKQLALNLAVELARGEVIVFTDVGVLLPAGTLRLFTRNFSDASIGAVSSVVRMSGRREEGRVGSIPETDNGEGSYLGFDFTVRYWEGLTGNVTGCCGPLYAVRRSCFIPFAPSACNDFVSALDVVQKGCRGVVDPEVIGVTRASTNYGVEFRRKLRTIVGGIDSLWQYRPLLWLLRHPLFCWQLWSHKVVRWLGPPAVVVGFFSCVAGAWMGSWAMGALALLFVGGVVLAGLSQRIPGALRRFFVLRLLSFAVVSLAAGLYAWVEFFSGRKYVLWNPTHRRTIELADAESSENSRMTG